MTSSAEPTVLLTEEALAGETAEVTGDRYRHLFRARRLTVGDLVRAVDGAGRARRGRIAAVDGSRGTLELGDDLPSLEPSLALTLIVGALKRERASWLVEKATELGVHAVRFVATSRTPRDYGRGTLGRWRRVAEAAVEQCGRALCPLVTGVHAWDEVAGLVAGTDRVVVLAQEGVTLSSQGAGERSAAVFVGPEGGFSNDEIEEVRTLGARRAALGARTLRVETAALAAASILLTGSDLR